jgi:37-kD nucleoid-associated bacterial protein
VPPLPVDEGKLVGNWNCDATTRIMTTCHSELEIAAYVGDVLGSRQLNFATRERCAMRDPQGITIKRLVVHILNNQKDPPTMVVSDEECGILPGVNSYFASHIQNSLADEKAKIAKFTRRNGAVRGLCHQVFQDGDCFLANSRLLAEQLFAPMRQTRAISPGDMVVCLYVAQNLNSNFIGIFKMDLSEAFTHDVRKQDGKVRIQITPQENVLPSTKQRLQKCAFIRPASNDYDMVILDNQISHLTESSGVANFFCRTFLECELWQTDREKTRLFRRLTTKWVDSHYDQLGAQQADVMTTGARQAIRSDSVNVREFARTLIPDPHLRADYERYMEDNNLHDVEFTPDQRYAEQVTQKKKYRGDGGIIVSGDADQFDELVHVDTTPDAQNRITVTIKTTRWTEQSR